MRAEDVPVVLVEHVDRARRDRIRGAGGDVDDLALTGDARVRLVVVLVPEVLLGSGADLGPVHGVLDPVVAADQAPAAPALAGNVTFGACDLVDGAHDHARQHTLPSQ